MRVSAVLAALVLTCCSSVETMRAAPPDAVHDVVANVDDLATCLAGRSAVGPDWVTVRRSDRATPGESAELEALSGPVSGNRLLGLIELHALAGGRVHVEIRAHRNVFGLTGIDASVPYLFAEADACAGAAARARPAGAP